MALSAANILQAKTGNIDATTAQVALDAGTQAGSTVTVEISLGGMSMMDGGMGGAIPAGFEFDGFSDADGIHYLHMFRKRNVAAGEGVAGSTTWDFSSVGPFPWTWRVTEWDAELEPVYPLEAISSNFATGTSPTSLSTGTAPASGNTSRSDLVCLAWHLWHRSAATAQSMTWSGHTNSFTVRDSLRWSTTSVEFGSCWSILFAAAAGAFETTATINLTTRNAGDVYVALLVVYAATTYG
jgi:hypothetical protein